MLSFLQNLPQSQNPEVFGMHDNVDISRELQETKQLFNNVLLTQGRTSGGAAGKTDEQLYSIATDILSKVKAIC
jgi:dynein heavy chain